MKVPNKGVDSCSLVSGVGCWSCPLSAADPGLAAGSPKSRGTPASSSQMHGAVKVDGEGWSLRGWVRPLLHGVGQLLEVGRVSGLLASSALPNYLPWAGTWPLWGCTALNYLCSGHLAASCFQLLSLTWFYMHANTQRHKYEHTDSLFILSCGCSGFVFFIFFLNLGHLSIPYTHIYIYTVLV